MSRTGAEMRASESVSKTVQDRITAIEKHLGQLCDDFGSYTRKTARVRDKGDQLSRDIAEYAEYEKWNPSLREGLTHFAESLSAVQDYREAQVHRLEKKVNDLKGAFSAQQREQNQKKKLEQMRTKTPQNTQQIVSLAETELQKASIDASRSTHALEQQIDSFESKKIRDMKKILREFVNIELVFHAKALELYTQCFQTLDVVDPEQDLEEFRKQVRPANTTRQEMARTVSQQSLDSQNSSRDSRDAPVNMRARPLPQSTPTRTPSAPPVSNGIRRE
ncbi:hypothetical protein BaRGS_00039558, partial [Batillaria attramentaria]